MKKSKRTHGKRRRTYQAKPRRRKTLQEILQPEPNEIWCDENTGQYLVMEAARLWTLGELLNKFYYIHRGGLKPIAWQLVEDTGAAIKTKDWYAVMYGGWHVRIVAGSNRTEGPHACQLWFKTPGITGPRKNLWIATLQLMGFYFNSEEMKTNLMAAIKAKEFYMSPQERDSTTEI